MKIHLSEQLQEILGKEKLTGEFENIEDLRRHIVDCLNRKYESSSARELSMKMFVVIRNGVIENDVTSELSQDDEIKVMIALSGG